MAMTDAERFEKVLEFMSDFFAMDDPRSSFNRVMRDLMDCCPEGVITGGMAVTFYVKDPRTTVDVDIILLDDPGDPGAFRHRFERVEGRPSTVRHKETGIEVDLLTPNSPLLNHALLQAAQTRFRALDRAGVTVRVASPEIVIAMKLRRALNRTAKGLQDRADIVTILNDNPELDLAPIKEYLSEEEMDLLDDLLMFRERMVETPSR